MIYRTKRIEIRLWDDMNPVMIDVEGVPETTAEWEQYRGVTLRTCTIDEAAEFGIIVAEDIVAYGESLLDGDEEDEDD